MTPALSEPRTAGAGRSPPGRCAAAAWRGAPSRRCRRRTRPAARRTRGAAAAAAATVAAGDVHEERGPRRDSATARPSLLVLFLGSGGAGASGAAPRFITRRYTPTAVGRERARIEGEREGDVGLVALCLDGVLRLPLEPERRSGRACGREILDHRDERLRLDALGLLEFLVPSCPARMPAERRTRRERDAAARNQPLAERRTKDA